MTPTTVCMVCGKVLVLGVPGAPVSHGLGPECLDAYRKSMGLPYVGFGTPEDDEKLAQHYEKPGRVEFGD